MDHDEAVQTRIRQLESQLERSRTDMVNRDEQVRVLEARCEALDLASQGFKRIERMLLKDRKQSECHQCQHGWCFHDAAGACIACSKQAGLELPDQTVLEAGPCARCDAAEPGEAAVMTTAVEHEPVTIIVGGTTVTVERRGRCALPPSEGEGL